MHHQVDAVILLELDFTVAVHKGRKHVLADHMSRVPNGEPSTGAEEDLPNAPLFQVDVIPKWAEEVGHYLANGLPRDKPLNVCRAQTLIKDASPYQLIARKLYKMCKDGILNQCVRED